MNKILIIPFLFISFTYSNDYNVIIGKEHNKYEVIENQITPPIIVTERVRLPDGGYTLWSDGYIEQWGKKNIGDDQVVFHISYTDVNSISFVIQEFSTGDQYGRHPKNLPQANGVYDFYRSDLVGTWMSSGY